MMDEAALVAERKNADMANLAVLVQMAIHTFPIADTKAAIQGANKQVREFSTVINKMIEDR